IASAARYIQYGVALAHATLGNCEALPHAMHAKRHEIVHRIITSGDRVEHSADLGLLLFDRNLSESEMGVGFLTHGALPVLPVENHLPAGVVLSIGTRHRLDRLSLRARYLNLIASIRPWKPQICRTSKYPVSTTCHSMKHEQRQRRWLKTSVVNSTSITSGTAISWISN